MFRVFDRLNVFEVFAVYRGSGINSVLLATKTLFNFSILSSLFQDEAGTTPADTAEDSVGFAEDQAGSSDATQAVTLKKPVLGNMPVGGRRNLILNSSNFDDVLRVFCTKSTDANEVTTFTATDGLPRFNLANIISTNPVITTIKVKPVEPGLYVFIRARDSIKRVIFELDAVSIDSDNSGYTSSITGPDADGFYTLQATHLSDNRIELLFNDNNTYTSSGGFSIQVKEAQVETGEIATPYQRTEGAYDVTEAGSTNGIVLYNDLLDDKLLFTPPAIPDANWIIPTPYGTQISRLPVEAIEQPVPLPRETLGFQLIEPLTYQQRAAVLEYWASKGAGEEVGAVWTTNDTTIYHEYTTTNGPYEIQYFGANGATTTSTSTNASVDVAAAGLTAPVVVVIPKALMSDADLTEWRSNTNDHTGPLPDISGLTNLPTTTPVRCQTLAD